MTAGVVTTASAQSDPSLPPTVSDDWRAEGTGVASVAIDMGILDPDRTGDPYDLAGGFSVQVVTKRTRWPAVIGLGGGVLLFDGTSTPGPIAGYRGDDGSFPIGTTTEQRSVQLRHAELVVRVERFGDVCGR